MEFVFRPAAESELIEAYEWYENRQQGLGNDFLFCVEAALSSIRSNPAIYREWTRPTVISNMRNWFKKILWLIGGLLWAGMALAGPLAPILEVPFPTYSFGEVNEGTIVSHDYLIKNTGKGILEIKEVQPG